MIRNGLACKVDLGINLFIIGTNNNEHFGSNNIIYLDGRTLCTF